MDYQIALSPDLNLTPTDFIAAWNEAPECRAVAEARLAKSVSAQYDPLSVGVAALGSVAAGVAANALYALIKRIVVKKGVTKQTEFVAIDFPDGSRLIVVKIIEEA
jgi:hypothetical protein